MPEQLAVYVTLLAVAAVESVILAVFVLLRHRKERGVLPFLILMLAVALWAGAYVGELASPLLEAKIIWAHFQYLGIATVPIAILVFVLDYTGMQRWLTQRNLILLTIIPITTLLLNWTNSLHHLFYRSVELSIEQGIPQFSATYGPWFWIHSAYSYAALLAAVVLLIQQIRRSPQLYQRQSAMLLIGLAAPWVANIIYIFDLSPLGSLDLTPFAFTVTGASFAWSLMSFRLLDVRPVARDAVVEGMKDAVIVLDGRARIIDMNLEAQRILGTTLSRAVGSFMSELVPDLRELILSFRDVNEIQTEITAKVDGNPHIFELSISMLKDRQGSPMGRVVVLHEVTQQKTAEEALARAHEHALEALRVKSRILAVVSHDFRTPLSVILGYCDILTRKLPGPLTDNQREYVERIAASALELTGLVTDLLDQAQLDNSTITLNQTQFEPQVLLEQLKLKTEQQAKDKGLALILEVSPELTNEPVYGDLARLDQVATNLITNAIKFTEKGQVAVRFFKRSSDQWGMRISDTGPGMTKEVLAHIFEPFWQADSIVTREQGGAGLGLSIARQLTAMMGGEIEVESKLGEGTVFQVLMPLKSLKEQIRETKIPSPSR